MQDSVRMTSETTRCPSCGALNPASAEWCGQCLARFEATVEEKAAPVAHDDGEAAADQTAGAVVHETGTEGDVAAESAAPKEFTGEPIERGAFTVSEKGITWTCTSCETVNEFEASHCVVCGTSFATMLKSSEAKERPQRDPGTAAMVSLFFPGAGHAYVGLWPQAIARGILSVWVLLVTFTSVTQGAETGGSILITIVYGLAALGLWLVAAHDAYREATNMPQLALLKGRMFLWIVLALVGVLVVLMMLTAAQARGGG